MTITLGTIHKAAPLEWHQNNEATAADWNIRGHEVSIEVTLHDGTVQEKRVVPNTGTANLFFPMDYTGTVTVTITGSRGGTDTATLSIS